MDNLPDIVRRAQTDGGAGPIIPGPTKPEPGNGATQTATAPALPNAEEAAGPDASGTTTATATAKAKPKPDVVDYKELWKPLPIAHIIMADYDYIVYLSTDSYLDWQTMPSIDAEVAKLAKPDVSAVYNRAAEVFAMPKEHLTDDQRLNIRTMIGEGYARLFDLDPKRALEMINAAGAYASARNQEIARGWQLKATAISTLAFVGIGCIAWLARGWGREVVGATAFTLLMGMCAGAVGALFSVLTRLATNSLDPSAGEKLHSLEGAARVVAGGIGAIFAQLAVQLSLILGVLKGMGLPALMFIALVAGASERLVPTIIKKTEGDAEAEQKRPAQ